MRDFVILFIQLIVTVVRLGLPGGLRSVVATVLVKHPSASPQSFHSPTRSTLFRSDGSGLDLFDELRRIDATVPILFITAAHSSATAIEAMKRGAYDYLVKPLDMGQVRHLVERALEMRRLMAVPVALV